MTLNYKTAFISFRGQISFEIATLKSLIEEHARLDFSDFLSRVYSLITDLKDLDFTT